MKDIYGIDLGTTNSLIGKGDKLLSGLVPSIVDLETGCAGEAERDNKDAKRSFKVNMSMSIEGELSIAASRYVLEELRHQAGGVKVKNVVISVPAYFKDTQRQATVKAAQLAGLNVVALINEPTAAAMYVSKDRKNLSVIFDLGGGTFDVSVIDSRFGNYDVQASDGLILGGDDFDSAIFRNLCKEAGLAVHHMSKQQVFELKQFCTKLKIQMQKERKDIVCDLSKWDGPTNHVFTESNYITLMKLVYAPALEKTVDVINESIPPMEDYSIILVGGSTRCPYLREWIEDELKKKPEDLFYDPDKVVAQGAALYAELIENGEAEVMVSDVTSALSIGLSDGTVRVIIDKNSKIPISNSTVVYNNVDSDKLTVNIYQGDSMLVSGNECIGTVVYDYGEVKKAMEGVVFIDMMIDSSGVITFSCKEMLKEPVVVTLERNKVEG